MFSSIRLGDSHLSLYDLSQPLQLPRVPSFSADARTGLNVITPGDELIGPGTRPSPGGSAVAHSAPPGSECTTEHQGLT